MQKKILLDKISKSLTENFSDWEITGNHVEHFKLRNKINNFVISVNYYYRPKIEEPCEIFLMRHMWWSYDFLNSKIKKICKNHDAQVSSQNYKLLNYMYDSKYTLRFNNDIIFQIESDKVTKKCSRKFSEKQIQNFLKYLDEYLTGSYKSNIQLNQLVFDIGHMSNIYISFEQEKDMAYMILKWSKYIITD